MRYAEDFKSVFKSCFSFCEASCFSCEAGYAFSKFAAESVDVSDAYFIESNISVDDLADDSKYFLVFSDLFSDGIIHASLREIVLYSCNVLLVAV